MQVEVAAMTKSTDDPELARQFLRFMLTPGFQSAIPTAQWMYPVIDLPEGLPPAYDRSEEHTSELQSLMRISYAVFCLKKKKTKHNQKNKNPIDNHYITSMTLRTPQ